MASKGTVRRSIVVTSRTSELDKVCRRLLSEAKGQDYGDDDIFAAHLALEEAFVNAVKHGNKGAPGKQVRVDYTITAEKIEILVKDEGSGFDPQAVPDPRRTDNLYKTTGRGLLLMRSFMDKVRFNEVGNCVKMVRYKSRSDLPAVRKSNA